MKNIFLVNFQINDAGFGVELQEKLSERGVDSVLMQSIDALMDLGNGDDAKPQLISATGTPLPIENQALFMKRRKPTSLFETTCYSTLFQRFAEYLGAQVLNESFKEHHRNIEKPAQYIKLIANGFRIPRTVLVHISKLEVFRSYIESIFTYPFVIKASGSGGGHVWKIDHFDEIAKHLATIENAMQKETIIVQEFITTSHEEFRALMFLGEIIAVIVRSSDSFRNNYAQGGKVRIGALTDEEIRMVKKAASISGLDYLGVDFMRDASGKPVFMELQTGPSLTVTKMVNALAVDHIADILKNKFLA